MRTRLASFIAVAALAFGLGARPSAALPFDSTAVEIVAFTDYQCPFCARAEATLSELEDVYGPALKVTVRHQPLAFHQHARGAAEAAEAARNQGRFEAMHARLFANQQALAPDDLLSHAAAIGLDVKRFADDLTTAEVRERVARDQAIATAVGVTGTPAFFINGRSLRGAQPIAAFKAIIDEEIAEARRANRRGDQWLSDRLSANNTLLWGYLYGGQVPAEPAPVRTPADRSIYRVEVDPRVDAIQGPADALVTLVVFLGYQCPFCKKHEATIAELMTRYAGKIRRVVKHAPLSIHPHGRRAAAAAICAQAQGRFWPMHESLFQDATELDEPALKNRASALGLDLRKFERCLLAKATDARIQADIDLAAAVTARGTPNTFINGRKLTGAKPLEDFVQVIDEELLRAQARLAQGTRPAELYPALIEDGKFVESIEATVHRFADASHTAILGNPRARVRVTFFADLQCPFSARAFPVMRQLVDEYRGKVAVAFKHFPLSFHEDATAAAKATLCAGQQQRFWEAAAELFANQKELPAMILALPDRIGIDLVKYGSCMNRDPHQAAIDADLAEGRRAEVKGTPTIYVQGRKVNLPGGYTLEALQSVIAPFVSGR